MWDDEIQPTQPLDLSSDICKLSDVSAQASHGKLGTTMTS